MTTIPTTDPTPAEIELLARMEAAMKRTHDAAPRSTVWTDTARAVLAEIADWQSEQVNQEGRESA